MIARIMGKAILDNGAIFIYEAVAAGTLLTSVLSSDLDFIKQFKD
jgi:hypothetical protein